MPTSAAPKYWFRAKRGAHTVFGIFQRQAGGRPRLEQMRCAQVDIGISNRHRAVVTGILRAGQTAASITTLFR